MLLEELGEGRDRDIEGIRAIVLLEALQLLSRLDTARLLEVADKRFRVGVKDVRQRGKRTRLGVVEETALLEEERNIGLVADLKWSSQQL
jgi:hypothetical protein